MDSEVTGEDLLDIIMDNNIDKLKSKACFINNDEINELGTILHIGIRDLVLNEEILDILIDNGIDINQQTKKHHDTAIHISIEEQDYTIMKCLLNRGANTKLMDRYRRTPKEYAIFLRKEKATNIIDYHDNLMKLFPKVHKDIVPYLWKILWDENVDELKLHINKFKLNNNASFFGPSLHTYIATGTKNKKVIIDSLLNAGADINKQNDNGDTPLHIAASVNDIDTFKYLLKQGADKDIKNIYGNNPIDIAEIKHMEI